MPRILFSILVVALLLLPSCASAVTREPWYDGENRCGTLVKKRVDAGFEYEYIDLADRLVRWERRDPQGELGAGDCVRLHQYDDQGRPTCVSHEDARGQLTPCAKGYAVLEIRYGLDPEGYEFEDHHFFDPERRPVANSDGFARKIVDSKDSRIERLRFFGLAGQPAAVQHLGVAQTARVEFAYLKGVTPVVYAVFWNAGGELLQRKRLSGLVLAASSSYYGAYGPYGYYQYPTTRTVNR